MTTPQNISVLYKKLIGEWQKGETKNIDAVEKTIHQLKTELATIGVLASAPDSPQALELIQIQRDMAEISAQVFCLKKDMEGFKRAIGQLKSLYGTISLLDKTVGESASKYHMLGLDLMCLLAQNNLSSFHMELERIATKVALENPYIAFPVKLEQALMEGAYNKIFLSKSNLPSPYYGFFMDILLDTVRGEIAACMEKAYRILSCKEAARLLFFDGSDAQRNVVSYGQKRKWELSKDKQTFVFGEEKKSHGDGLLDASRLIAQNIFYAKQLEMIP